jgi:hypothetical protein
MLANGTIKTIENNEDIYISLTQICEYFTQSTINMSKEVDDVNPKEKKYAMGLLDMMHTITDEFLQLGKFEAQRRLIDTPQDILDMFDNKPFGNIE